MASPNLLFRQPTTSTATSTSTTRFFSNNHHLRRQTNQQEDNEEEECGVQSLAPRNPNINPPSSTRPPRLDTPARDPSVPLIKYLYLVGKAYLSFYKAGLQAVIANRHMLKSVLEKLPKHERPPIHSFSYPTVPPPRGLSRSDWVLLWRVRRDLGRLPAFGLVLLVFGELTPLLVWWLDAVIPGTCKIPRQVLDVLAKTEARRRQAFEQLEQDVVAETGGDEKAHGDAIVHQSAEPLVRLHILRSLSITSKLWEYVPLVPTRVLWWYMGGAARMAFLEGDDMLLVQAQEGVSGLIADEVKTACADRGIDVAGKKDGELRMLLGDWLRLTTAANSKERRGRMAVLLATRTGEWPQTRDFALPEWEL